MKVNTHEVASIDRYFMYSETQMSLYLILYDLSWPLQLSLTINSFFYGTDSRLTRSQTAGDLINLMNEARMRYETISSFITTCMGWIFFLQCHVNPLVESYWSNPSSVIIVLLYFPTTSVCVDEAIFDLWLLSMTSNLMLSDTEVY